MKTRFVFECAVVAGAVLSLAGLSYAQDAGKQSTQGASSSSQQKTAAKPHKVWTEDDLGTIRSRGNVTVAAAQNPAIPASTDTASAAAPKQGQAVSPKASGKAALSNPKTADEADSMIAWEQRDIDSQQQYVDNLQSKVEQAPPSERERLQKVLQERQQILADTRREQQDLIAQRKDLQKKKTGDSSVAEARQP